MMPNDFFDVGISIFMIIWIRQTELNKYVDNLDNPHVFISAQTSKILFQLSILSIIYKRLRNSTGGIRSRLLSGMLFPNRVSELSFRELKIQFASS